MIIDVKLNTNGLTEDIKDYILNSDNNVSIYMSDGTELTNINITDKTAKLQVGLLMIIRLGRENFRYIEEVKLVGHKTNGKIYLEFELVMGDGYNEKSNC